MAVLKSGGASSRGAESDGLAAGKGVIISPDLHDGLSQVHAMMVEKRFGQAGARLVVKSVRSVAKPFVLSDGTRALPLVCRGS
jgi:phosphoribosylamine--glycine ligase